MLKLVLVGDQKVGKLSLNQRYSLNAEPGSNAINYPLDYYSRNISIGHKDIEIQTWHYNHEVSRYIQQAFIYRKAQGIIICYAIDDRQSFESVQKWIEQIKQYSREDIEIILIGTKCDLQDQRQVSYKEGQQLADQLGVIFFETSSKKDINVKESFNIFKKKYLTQALKAQAIKLALKASFATKAEIFKTLTMQLKLDRQLALET